MDGICSLTNASSIGRVEAGIMGREGLVGAMPVLLGNDRVPHDHVIQVPGDAFRICTAVLSAAVDRSAFLRRLLLRDVQTELVQACLMDYVDARFTAEARLARWVLMC